MKKTKKILLAILLIIAACVLLAGCSGDSQFISSEPFALAFNDVVGGVEVYATGNLSEATEVTIPATYEGKKVVGIAKNAFNGCVNLGKVTIEDDAEIEYIGSNAFTDCAALTSFSVPRGVEELGSYVFARCKSLEYILIPNTVDDAGGLLFYGCDVDELDVYYESPAIPSGWHRQYGSNDKTSNAVMFNVWLGVKDVELSNEEFEACVMIDDTVAITHYIGKEYNVEVPNEIGGRSVSKICVRAFGNCSTVQTVNLPDTLKSIDREAFSSCTLLESITVPSGVTSIGNKAFSNCPNLEYVIIPNTVDKLGELIFVGCDQSNLDVYCEAASIPSGWSEKFGSNSSTTKAIQFNFWWGTTGIEYSNENYLTGVKTDGTLIITHYKGKEMDVTIPASIGGRNVSEIAAYAFNEAFTVQTVTIPNTVTKIGDYAFRKCISLTSITIPNSVTSLGKYVFYGNTALAYVYIPASVTTVGKHLFMSCDASLLKVYCEATEKPGGWDRQFASNNTADHAVYFTFIWGATN